MAFAERDDAEEGHLRKGNDDGMDADDDTVMISREQVAMMKAQKNQAERKQSQSQALAGMIFVTAGGPDFVSPYSCFSDICRSAAMSYANRKRLAIY